MARTSLTDPLRIDVVAAGEGCGRIGITFCPGKHDADAATGAWARDLDLDLDAIRAWGALAVVSLVEPHELAQLRVEGLGDGVRRRGMAWFHLPIVDGAAPDARFERDWEDAGAALRARLRAGGDIVVHCRGGLGRAGTVAALLLVELGTTPRAAIARVRAARKDAIETFVQEAFVLSLRGRAG